MEKQTCNLMFETLKIRVCRKTGILMYCWGCELVHWRTIWLIAMKIANVYIAFGPAIPHLGIHPTKILARVCNICIRLFTAVLLIVTNI